MLTVKSLLNGQSQHKSFFSGIARKNLIQYDYRHTNGDLFSTVKPTLEKCIEAKDKWMKKHNF